MSFSSQIKSEIAYNQLKDCCALAELSALLQLTASLKMNNKGLYLCSRSENPTTAKRILLLLKQLYAIETNLNVYQKINLRKNNIYEISIKDNVMAILKALGIYNEKGLAPYPYYDIVKKDCCARAYIAGCFLAFGSCNNPDNKNYHLELKFADEYAGSFVIRQLKRFDIEAKLTKRRNKNIVYLKKVEQISYFLRCIGAQEAFMNFENRRISRDFINSRIRVDNCDIANYAKAIQSAKRHLEAIAFLERRNLIVNLDEKLKEAIALRRAYPEDSLSDLALKYQKRYHQKISRSGLKHRYDKIMLLAEKIYD